MRSIIICNLSPVLLSASVPSPQPKMEAAAAQKTQFLQEFGDDYGYSNGSKGIDEIRATEFKRLDQSDTVYLDHAGATLYSELQMESIFKDLTSNIYGNPHSQSDTSSATTEILRGARQQVLDYFNASPKDYTCVFTSGATAALKLVGEAFPWSRDGCFMHTMENHNSVLGIREYALNQGAAAFAIDVEEYVHDYGASNGNVTPVKIIQHPVQRREQANHLEGEPTGDSYSLFAFPSECNFSGFRFNLQLVNLIKQDARKVLEDSPFSKGPWMVLIDAAKGCATQPPDLSEYPADFVALSFYKLFGYPTGLGALLVRKDAAKLLKKTYFSGGTVSASFADMDFVKRRESIEELFEDGTSSFLSIASLRHGFKILNSLTTPMICRHTASLTAYVKKILLSLRHEDGSRVCVLYGLHGSEVIDYKSGPTVTFNLKRSDGSWVGYREVEKLASLSGIQLRTGCFCNPGACAKYLDLSHQDLLLNLEAGHTCWDDNDVIHGKPTGAVRVSFGYMSTYEDAKKFIDVITSSFVSSPSKSGSKILLRTRSISPSPEGQERRLVSTGYILKSITIYPIKSCAGFSVDSWPLSSAGLLHDREWLLKSLAGEILTQKKVPEMCFISTHIDLKRGIMFVESPRCREKLQVNLKMDLHLGEGKGTELDTKRYEERHYDNDINLWFSNAVGRPCTLLRHPSSKYFLSNHEGSAGLCRNVGNKLNFANDAQFLLVSEESVSELNCRLSLNQQKRTHGAVVQVDPMRFRPNFVISGGEPFVEDGWRSITIGNINFVSLGGCNRCQMINSVQQAGQVQRSNEPLATLASYRRVKGKILFGILLRLEFGDDEFDTDSWLRVGQEVHPS